MDDLFIMMLLGQEEPSLWRVLAPLITIIVFVVFKRLNDKIKQKERQQKDEEDARRRSEDAASVGRARAEDGQAGGVRSGQARDEHVARRAEPIRRYQAQIPSAPGHGAEGGGGQAGDSELIIVADDISDKVHEREFGLEQQRRLRAEAIRRAQALEAQRSRESAHKARAKAAAPKIQAKPRRKLPALKALPKTEVSESAIDLVCPGQTISPSQIRRAIVWAEILGAPRALRGYSDPSGIP